MPSAPAASCAKWVVQDAHEYSQRSHRKSPGIPARNGFTAYVVLSPAIGLSCHRRLRKSLPANLTPASRRQDHTILPSASKTLSSEAPLAATASSPASVTIAIRPSSGVDGGGYKGDLRFLKIRIFFASRLDRVIRPDPARQFRFYAQPVLTRLRRPHAARLTSSASARYDSASARCSLPIFSEPSRSASVRATRSTR